MAPALNTPGYVTDLRGALELGVPVFTAYELATARRLASVAAGEAQAGRDAAEAATRLRTIEAFVGVLARERLLAALDERIASSSKEVGVARRLKERGLVLGSDYFAALALLSGLGAWRVRAERERDAHAAQLAVLAGGPIRPAGALGEEAYPVEPPERLAEAAAAYRPEARQAALYSEAARVLERQAKASVLPRVEAFAALELDSSGRSPAASNRLLGIRARMPFAEPAYAARRERARAAVEAAGAGARAAQDGVRSEAAYADAAYRGAADALAPLREMRDRTLQALELLGPLYREGRQSVLDVLRAEEAAAKAEAALIDDRAALHAGWARRMFAAGRLDGAAVSEISRRLEAR